MLNVDDNENGFKTNRFNQQKNKLHVQHTFSSTPFADHLGEKDIHFREVQNQ